MALQCKKCGSRKTQTVPLKDLEKTGVVAAGATVGFINPDTLMKTVEAISNAVKAVFGWLSKREDMKHPVVVCKDCGYYERA